MLKSRLITELFREFAKERRDQRGYNRENDVDNDNVRSIERTTNGSGSRPTLVPVSRI